MKVLIDFFHFFKITSIKPRWTLFFLYLLLGITSFLNLAFFGTLILNRPAHNHLRSSLSPSFLSCTREVGNNLPINASGILVAHHWDASGARLWNENIRFDPFPSSLPHNPLILDVGGHTDAKDSERLLQMFPAAKIHIYEPVPLFFANLQKKWLGKSCCNVHNIGLGGSTRNVTLRVTDLAGQSTFLMEGSTEGEETTTMHIVDGLDVFSEFLLSGSNQIDILHINCEGCEWEFLERLVSTDMLRHIGVLQVSFHNYGSNGVGLLIYKYCLIREALEESHYPVNVVPFGWERWVLKGL